MAYYDYEASSGFLTSLNVFDGAGEMAQWLQIHAVQIPSSQIKLSMAVCVCSPCPRAGVNIRGPESSLSRQPQRASGNEMENVRNTLDLWVFYTHTYAHMHTTPLHTQSSVFSFEIGSRYVALAGLELTV